MCGLPVCAHACVRSSHDGNRTMERDYKRMRAEAAEQAKGQGLDGRVPAAEIKDALKRQKVAPEDEGGAGAAGGKEDSSLPHAAALAGSEGAAEAQEAQGGEPQAETGAQDGTGGGPQAAQAQAQVVAEVPAAAPAQTQVQAQGELGAANLGFGFECLTSGSEGSDRPVVEGIC